jgi:hypothetical protein
MADYGTHQDPMGGEHYSDVTVSHGAPEYGSTTWDAESHGLSSGGMYEGNLHGAFADHNRQGMWASVGRQEDCWELPMMESTSTGDTRHIVATESPAWEHTTVVHTGLTHGDNGSPATPMYDSELPNH